MHLELERAERMRDPLDVVAERVRPIVHRVNIPSRAGLMMFRMPDAIEHRIAQPHVRRGHIDFGAQGARAIRKFTCLHPGKEIEILADGAKAKRTLLAESPEFISFF